MKQDPYRVDRSRSDTGEYSGKMKKARTVGTTTSASVDQQKKTQPQPARNRDSQTACLKQPPLGQRSGTNKSHPDSRGRRKDGSLGQGMNPRLSTGKRPRGFSFPISSFFL